jgi:hypothetical protein
MAQRHHRRHHTWPYCGSDLCLRETRSLESNVFNPVNGPSGYVPVIVEELLCDDMGMPELSRQPKRLPRLWFRSSDKTRNEEATSTSSPDLTWRHTPRRVFRRLTRRPPLSKSRSLFVVPSNMRSVNPNVMSDWIPPQTFTRQFVISDTERGRSAISGADAARFIAERRHRRCHSEQPRAWRRPSATIWPLREQEE